MTKDADGNDIEYTLTIHKQFSFTMPYNFSYSEDYPNLLTFVWYVKDDDDSSDGQGHYKSRPIVTLHKPMEPFQSNTVMQIAILTPFLRDDREKYNQLLITTEQDSAG